MADTENILVPLPGFTLPRDLPWRTRFVDIVEAHSEGETGRAPYEPPRFFGYYLCGDDFVAVAGPWAIGVVETTALERLPDMIDVLTGSRFPMTCDPEDDPEFMLVYDRYDGACWLWRYPFAQRFLEAEEALLHDDAG